jgi:DHA1 family bicyclomycin/chloramphenicol resistance-like MFS transporter
MARRPKLPAMRVRPESFAFTLLLGALAALPPLSIDMGLPAFAALERELGASAAGAGLTLSVFLAGFACGQLVLGPLSDRFGRRPVLLGGLAIYAVTGGLCAAAPSIATLIAFRLIAGAAAAAGTVLTFAIVRDLFSGAAARTRLSHVTMVLSVAPMIAPTLGGWALILSGWRAIYGCLGVAGAALLLAVAAGLPETMRPAASGIGVLGGMRKMLGHRGAIAYAMVNACNFGALFAYVSGSPLVLMGSLGVSAPVYGLLFAATSAGIMAGSWLNGRLSQRAIAPRLPLAVALGASLATAGVVLALTAAGAVSLVTLMPLLVAHMLCRGVVGPNATHGALEPMGEIAGLASAVLGFLMMAVGAIASGVESLLYPWLGPPAMAITMTAFAGAALVAWRVAERPPIGLAAEFSGR